jgi:hypothetical protein
VNFAPEFVAAVDRALPSCPMRISRDGEARAGPLRWIGYIYAQFFSTAYRQRYASFLRVDFPRVFLTKNLALWQALSDLGCRLLALHLGHRSWVIDLLGPPFPPVSREDAHLVGPGTGTVATGFPKFSDQAAWINPEQRVTGLSHETWDFCVGGHQVSRKWLRDRRGRTLSPAEIAQYCYLVQAVRQTREVMAKIDRVIESRGGWRNAFFDGN